MPPHVSDYIVRAIDSKSPSDTKVPMPEDFKEHTEAKKIPLRKHGCISIDDLNRLTGKTSLHDRYRNKVIQEEDLKFLFSVKGKEYIKAYYLHIFLDYFEHQRSWIQQTGESIEDSIDKCHKKKCVSLPETAEILNEIIAFLKSHSLEIKHELGL